MFSVRRAAILLAALAAGSTMLGLIRDVVIATVFGASAELDAYFVAQGLMNVVLGLVAGAMAKASVPVFAREAAAEGGRCPAHSSLNVALSVTLVVLGLGALLMAVGARPVVAVLAPGFEGSQATLAEQLTRVVLIATVLIAGTNLLAAVAQAHGRFGWSGVQGVPFNLVMITAAVVWGPTYGVGALAWGFVAGSLVRLLIQLVPLRQIGLRVRWSFDLREPGFLEVARLLPALLVGSAVANVNTLVDRAVASTLMDGSISALSYGWRLVTLGETVLVASLLTALYPVLGSAASNADELRRLLARGLAVSTVILTPLCVLLLWASVPVVIAIFGHGEFSADDVRDTALAVSWYAPALVALGWREVVVRASYALGDAQGPVLVALAAMVVNVIGDLTAGLRWGIPGLAASTTGSLLFAAAANTWLLRRRHQVGSDVGGLLRRNLVAALLAVGAGGAVAAAVDAGLVAGTLAALGDGILIGIGVALTYGGALLVMRAPEGKLLADAVLGLVRRR